MLVRYLFSTLFLLSCCAAQAQNLVPNPSFEEHTGCPQFVPDLDGKCNNWLSFRGSPDYFNSCSSNIGFYNPWGYQEAHTGQAYAGVGCYQGTISNLREHLGVQIKSPLVIGEKYYLSFFISPAFNYLYTNIASNKMGALLTTYLYSDPNLVRAIPNLCVLKTDSIIQDTLTWFKISGSFIADSVYQYLVIGNFFDDNNIDTFHLPYKVVPQASYYYIDDVCLSSDSVYSETWTSQFKISTKEIARIYPNPSAGNFNISTDYPIQEIEVVDKLGKTIFTKNGIDNNFCFITLDNLPNGLYFINIKSKGHILNSKINLIK